MEDNTCVKETDSTDIEASLYCIASGLQNAAERIYIFSIPYI